MCGIAGLIGLSKNPSLSYEIITNLFKNTEARGVDASGFWGINQKQEIIYHKEPIRASVLVEKNTWKKVEEFNPTLLLVHARAASLHVGSPHCNTNNHPFVSTDRNLSLIHNGRIVEFDLLKSKFEVLSGCDSEILLRIIESASLSEEISEFSLPETIARRLAGIKDIYSLINSGHMAVAVGEVVDNKKYLWLFRNKHRSLWLVDLRKVLGQIMFCSTSEIWSQTISECRKAFKSSLMKVKAEEIWCFEYDEEIDIFHWKVNCHEEQMELDDKKYPIQKREPTNHVISSIVENVSSRDIYNEISITHSLLNSIGSTIYKKTNNLDKVLEYLKEANSKLKEVKREVDDADK